MFFLIKNGTIYAPDYLGRQDILVGCGKILLIQPKIDTPLNFDAIEIDAAEDLILPGFIDQHVHFAGAGGEGGPASRTPEIMLSELTTGGITTVVGLLGVDGVTRSMNGLLAKARALEIEGITSYIYSGAYQIPTRTITGNVRSDLVLIDKVIGVGEIAISDHRSAQPTLEMLIKIASEARVGGMLGNKAGVVHIHVGEGRQGLSLLFDAVNRSDIPVTQFVPTHVNRLSSLFDEAIRFVRMGGIIDLTSGITPENDSPQSMEVYQSLQAISNQGLNFDQITVSSDANGSMPVFDSTGKLIRLEQGSVQPLWKDIVKAVKAEVIPLPAAVSLITRNVARLLKFLPQKGIVAVGSDADLVLVDRTSLEIKSVFAKGRLMVDQGAPKILGTFEK